MREHYHHAPPPTGFELLCPLCHAATPLKQMNVLVKFLYDSI